MRLIHAYTAVGAVLLTGAGLSMTIPAAATDHGLVPAVKTDGHEFYSQDQIDSAWQKAVGEFPEQLPAGQHFPELAPAFFHPADGTSFTYETGIPGQMVARYWRCSWLQESDAITPKTILSVNPESRVDAQLDPARWQEIPAVKQNFDVAGYLSTLDDYARSTGLDARRVEFQNECSIYQKETR